MELFFVIVAIIALAGVVGVGQWLRVRRERNILQRTQQNAIRTVERQRQQRSMANQS
jgi:hypothetical protein